jgi:hypothetical protein
MPIEISNVMLWNAAAKGRSRGLSHIRRQPQGALFQIQQGKSRRCLMLSSPLLKIRSTGDAAKVSRHDKASRNLSRERLFQAQRV